MQTMKNYSRFQLAGLILCFYSASSFSLENETAVSMTLTSSAFAQQHSIPKSFTCDGSDVSPGLTWTHVPPNAKSLVLIVDDPDAPSPILPIMTWVHWVLYNIPPTVSELPENISPKNLPKGILEGKNNWNETGYKGPCPSFGRHRYIFKLYALDTALPDLNQPDKATLKKAMEGHIIGKTELTGTYKH